jgi:cytochrome c biogenesis protein CcdA
MSAIPVSVAFAAGSVAVLNPCSFPLLPAWLSFYAGSREERLPRAGNRATQGLLAGAEVSLGFLAVFAATSLPIAYGAAIVADSVPWLGIVVGAMLAVVGAATLSGLKFSVRVRRLGVRRERRSAAMLLFGVGYGLASLGCTFPIFLALLGSALAARGTGGLVAVFAAYAAGTTLVLLSVSVAAALLRHGLLSGLRRALPLTSRIAGALLLASGAYLTYYWSRIHFGPAATLIDDPLVGPTTRLAARIDTLVHAHDTAVATGAATVLLVAVALVLRQWRGARH